MTARDVQVRSVLLFGALVAGAVAVAVVVVALLLRHWGIPLDVDRDRLPAGLRWPAPALQSAPQFDLQRYLAEKQRLLNRMEPVPDEPDIVRIPIETAMALMAERAASAPGSRP